MLSAADVYMFVFILNIVLYIGASSAIQNMRLDFLYAKFKVCLKESNYFLKAL